MGPNKIIMISLVHMSDRVGLFYSVSVRFKVSVLLAEFCRCLTDVVLSAPTSSLLREATCPRGS